MYIARRNCYFLRQFYIYVRNLFYQQRLFNHHHFACITSVYGCSHTINNFIEIFMSIHHHTTLLMDLILWVLNCIQNVKSVCLSRYLIWRICCRTLVLQKYISNSDYYFDFTKRANRLNYVLNENSDNKFRQFIHQNQHVVIQRGVPSLTR